MFRVQGPRLTGSPCPLTDSPRKGFLVSPIGVGKKHVGDYDAHILLGQRAIKVDGFPLLETFADQPALCSERKSVICSRAVGTFAFASSLTRFEANSTCIPGPAFLVEAYHPQMT